MCEEFTPLPREYDVCIRVALDRVAFESESVAKTMAELGLAGTAAHQYMVQHAAQHRDVLQSLRGRDLYYGPMQ